MVAVSNNLIKSTESFEFKCSDLIEEDWCNEVIRIIYMLKDINDDKTSGKAINRIKLSLNQQDSFTNDHLTKKSQQYSRR